MAHALARLRCDFPEYHIKAIIAEAASGPSGTAGYEAVQYEGEGDDRTEIQIAHAGSVPALRILLEEIRNASVHRGARRRNSRRAANQRGGLALVQS